jgi:hypothetical protein
MGLQFEQTPLNDLKPLFDLAVKILPSIVSPVKACRNVTNDSSILLNRFSIATNCASIAAKFAEDSVRISCSSGTIMSAGSAMQASDQRSIVPVRRIFFCSSITP